MARIRSIKPGFFLNEDVASLPFQWRLLFVGLWTQADREGRLEDRPMRLKAALFPYDAVSIHDGLVELEKIGLIVRYEGDGQKLIAIPTFGKHQIPHRMEPPSELPGVNGERDGMGFAPNEKRRAAIYERDGMACSYCGRDLSENVRARCVDHVIPLARGGSHNDANLVTACKTCNGKKSNKTPEEAGFPWPAGYGEVRMASPVNGVVNDPRTVDPLEGKGTVQGNGAREGNGTTAQPLRERFERFWAGYPKKTGKDAAWREWLKRSPSVDLTERILASVQQQRSSSQWLKDGGQFIPHPRTWLNQGRWQDEAEVPAERQPWICPHVKRCDHREMCENNSILGRPRKAAAS